jgi:hypothetical protein
MIDQDEIIIKDIFRVFILEHWARFYFTKERNGKTFLEIPEEELEHCRKAHPDLAPLLEESTGKELTYESSCQNVGAFVCRIFDGVKYPPGKVSRTLDSKPFRIEMHLFSLWLQGHEGYLEQKLLSFDDWLEMFVNWKQMDQVKDFIAKLQQSPPAEGSKAKTTH